MAADVFFMDLRAELKRNLFQKFETLLLDAGIEGIVKKADLFAVKIHFGELGGTGYVDPPFVAHAVRLLKQAGAKPFITDANTLYVGSRAESVSHLVTAIKNGFSYAVVEAPLIIADGLKGGSEIAVGVKLPIYGEVFIGHDIVIADGLVAVTHFKGHEMTGFGGALKNIGMGCASRKGKLAQHSEVSPKILAKKCIGCGECAEECPADAITLKGEGEVQKAVLNGELCIGCGKCIVTCRQMAIEINWHADTDLLQKKMVEHAAGVLNGKAGKTLFVSFVNKVSPQCDCYPFSDVPVVDDIGILASKDPVAIDQAAVDLVNRRGLRPGSPLAEKTGGELAVDVFRTVYPHIDYNVQLAYAQEHGLGTREYRLKEVK